MRYLVASCLTSGQLTVARSALIADVELLSHGGFADVQISRHACKHPRVLPNAACVCPALGPVEPRDGMPGTTIITHPTHPTHPTVTVLVQRSEDNPEKIATGKRVPVHAREWQSDPLQLCL